MQVSHSTNIDIGCARHFVKELGTSSLNKARSSPDKCHWKYLEWITCSFTFTWRLTASVSFKLFRVRFTKINLTQVWFRNYLWSLLNLPCSPTPVFLLFCLSWFWHDDGGDQMILKTEDPEEQEISLDWCLPDKRVNSSEPRISHLRFKRERGSGITSRTNNLGGWD